MPFAERRRDREDASRPLALRARLRASASRFVVDEVGPAQRDHLGLVGEAGAIGVELAADDAPGLDRILAGGIDQVEQHSRALDMAEEAVADAGAFGGALDQAGDVGERRTRGPCGGPRRAAGGAW